MLKNYSSTVAASRSVAWIEQRLVDFGASNISKRYDPATKQLLAIMFQIPRNGMVYPVVLPARIPAAEKALRKARSSRRPPTSEAEQRIKEQTERTAWKILADWVDAQLAMIVLEQVEFLEVFMAFLYDSKTGRSFFEQVRDNGFKALPAHEAQK